MSHEMERCLFKNRYPTSVSIGALMAVLASNFFPLPVYPYNAASVMGIVIIAAVFVITLYTWIKNPEAVRKTGSTSMDEITETSIE